MVTDFQAGDKVRIRREQRAHHGEEGVVTGFPSARYVNKDTPEGTHWQGICQIYTVRLSSGTEITVPIEELEKLA